MFGGLSIAALVVGWSMHISSQNQIFPLTLAAACFTFVFSLIRFRTNLKMSWLWALVLALSTPFAFTATFEAAYQNLAYFVRPSIFHTPLAGEIILASWVLLGLSSFPFWKASKNFYLLLIVDAFGFGAWAIIGYPQISEQSQLLPFAIALNVVTKLTFALTFIALIYEGTKKIRARFEF